jgi:hypothetical protein
MDEAAKKISAAEEELRSEEAWEDYQPGDGWAALWMNETLGRKGAMPTKEFEAMAKADGQNRANHRPKSQVKVRSAGSVSPGQRRFHPNDIRAFSQSSERFRRSERRTQDQGH